MTTHVQQARTGTGNPANGELKPGQLYLEMSALRLWFGVDTSIDATGRRLFLDAPANTSAINGKLNLTGGLMTGPLAFLGANANITLARDPVTPLQAATKQYVDALGNYGNATFLPLNGGTMTGPLVLNGPPTQPLNPATKQYVDTLPPLGGPYLPLTGGTLSGQLIVNGNVTSNAAIYASTLVRAGSGANGYVQLQPGSTVNTGYVAFFNAATNRAGYIGFANTTALNIAVDSPLTTISLSANMVAAAANFQAGFIHSLGGTVSDSTLQAQNGRVISYNPGGNNPSLTVWAGNQSFAAGIYLDGNNNLVFSGMDGGGNPSGTYLGYFNTNGDFWARNAVTTAYLHSTGVVQADSEVRCNDIMNYSGAFYVGGNYNYYMNRDPNSGQWNWVEGGNLSMYLESNGPLHAVHGLFPSWYGDFYLTADTSANVRSLNWANGWAFNWDGGGTFNYWIPGSAALTIRPSDWAMIDWHGPVAGNGAYINISDDRVKSDVTPWAGGLDIVLALEPISFQRVSTVKRAIPPRVEIGFSAQQVRGVLPHAVFPVGTPMPGANDIDGDDPILAVSHEVITAALVNAVREIVTRLDALEARA